MLQLGGGQHRKKRYLTKETELGIVCSPRATLKDQTPESDTYLRINLKAKIEWASSRR